MSQGLVENYYVDRFIKWPTGQAALNVIEKFEELQGFPSVIGAIDGSHIPITPPEASSQDYQNRKKFHSIQLQAVCDAELIITDAFCGFPRRSHDSRVLRNSPLFQTIAANPDHFFPGNSHLIGDAAYPLLKWLLPPFKKYGNLTPMQRRYNKKQSSTRMKIEHLLAPSRGSLEGSS